MALQVLTNSKIWVAGYDVSGDSNACTLDHSAAPLDDTTFASGGFVSRKGGLQDTSLLTEGFYDPAGPTDVGDIGQIGALPGILPATLAPFTGAEGEVSYSFAASRSKFSYVGKVGDLFRYRGELLGSSDLARATIIANKTGIVAGGNGSSFNLGAPIAGQSVYASLHVLGYTGAGAFTATIQSDTATGFPSPINQIAFAPASAIGGQFAAPLPGAIPGETWWRVLWTFTGTSVAFVVNLAIQ